jgi:hypothetical protein
MYLPRCPSIGFQVQGHRDLRAEACSAFSCVLFADPAMDTSLCVLSHPTHICSTQKRPKNAYRTDLEVSKGKHQASKEVVLESVLVLHDYLQGLLGVRDIL